MSKIKFLVMDVDGTLTDGKIYMGSNGELMKAFNIKDGAGIHDILIPNGINPVIITGRNSEIVMMRCRELGIKEVYQGVSNKAVQLREILEKNNDDFDSVAYIGDDINDLPCMNLVKQGGGLIGSPADAVDSVKTLANFISSKKGGEGAVRDFIEWILTDNMQTSK